MTEELTQEQKDALAAAEAKKLKEEQEKLTIPKARFDEVNNKAKELEKLLAEKEKAEKEAEKKKLEEEGKIKELLDITQAENDKLKLDGLRRDLIQEAITSNKLHPRLSKMVKGSTEEDIKKSLEEAVAYQEELKTDFKIDLTAKDNVGNPKTTKTPLSTEEYMRLVKENPAEADRLFKESVGIS